MMMVPLVAYEPWFPVKWVQAPCRCTSNDRIANAHKQDRDITSGSVQCVCMRCGVDSHEL